MHQPGIATPFLDYLAFGAIDVVVDRAAELRELLVTLTVEAERLMAANRVARPPDSAAATFTRRADRDTWPRSRALRLRNARSVRARAVPAGGAAPATGVSRRRACPLSCGGDLCVQVCAREPELARDALAQLIAVTAGGARSSWVQEASARREPGDRPDGRPRNLLGFKDGTNNLRRGKDLDRHVWVTGRERSWMLGGTFLVVRRIRIRLVAWDALSLAEQERVIGRHRDSGAPLGQTREFDHMRLDDDATPPDSHARVAAPASNGGVALLRRGYSYDNGTDDAGRRDAGLLLFFYQRDPRRQFVPLQQRLINHDALTPFTQCVGSAVFAIPPGTAPNGYIADGLLLSSSLR